MNATGCSVNVRGTDDGDDDDGDEDANGDANAAGSVSCMSTLEENRAQP